MGVNIGKQTRAAVSSAVVRLEWNSKQGEAGVELAAVLLDSSGTASSPRSVIFRDNPRSSEGAAVWSDAGQRGSDCASISLDLNHLAAEILEVLVSAFVADASNRAQFKDSDESSATVIDSLTNRELHRWELEDDFPTSNALELLRIYRVGRSWQLEPLGTAHTGGIDAILRHYAPGISRQPSTTAPSARPTNGDPSELFTQIVATRPFDGYCAVAERLALLREAALLGLEQSRAEILLELELERRQVANEHVLLQRLDAILRRFTDNDKKLDDKERMDALQLACRPAAGCSKGLQYDVAEDYITRFCRANGVKVKVGLLRWALP